MDYIYNYQIVKFSLPEPAIVPHSSLGKVILSHRYRILVTSCDAMTTKNCQSYFYQGRPDRSSPTAFDIWESVTIEEAGAVAEQLTRQENKRRKDLNIATLTFY